MVFPQSLTSVGCIKQVEFHKPSRYPVILRSFQLNPGSGGQGLYKGGDGVIRELVFRRPLTLSILSERRAFCPYGLKGAI